MGSLQSSNKQQVLGLIQENPFVTQQDLADKLALSRSAVASHISSLMQEGLILGRAYMLPHARRITCLGGANLDRKIQSLQQLQLGTSNPASVTESHGGVARNIAENLGRMGAFPSLITMTGQDNFGEALLSHCRSVGVDVTQSIRLEQHKTGTYTAVLDVTGEMSVALADMKIYDNFSVERLTSRWHVLATSDLVVSDTNLPVESLHYLVKRSREEAIKLCIVPVSSPKVSRLPNDLHGITLLVANMDEISALSNSPVNDLESIWTSGQLLLDRGCDQIVITMGSDGCAYLDSDGRGVIPAQQGHVVDVTGAGDAFAAGVVYGINKGIALPAACRFATRLSSLTLATRDTVSCEIRPETMNTWLRTVESSSD